MGVNDGMIRNILRFESTPRIHANEIPNLLNVSTRLMHMPTQKKATRMRVMAELMNPVFAIVPAFRCGLTPS